MDGIDYLEQERRHKFEGGERRGGARATH